MTKSGILNRASSVGMKKGAQRGQLPGIIEYAEHLIDNLRKVGKVRMADRYTTSMNSFRRYRQGKDISLEQVNGTLMLGYESFLRDTGICRNTISFYMRNLRAIYNRAVDEELIGSTRPFKSVYTGIDKTMKRAISLEAIQRLKRLDLTERPKLDYARDMFLFSFYMRGMSFIDMAYLKKKDLHEGVVCYRRQKTAQQLTIKWEPPMQEIVCKYYRKDTPYLLPILGKVVGNSRVCYKQAYKKLNRYLRKLGDLLSLPIPLTTYVARHSWASIAKSRHIPIAIISEALGHDSELTTKIYLASLGTSDVDEVNGLIINSL